MATLVPIDKNAQADIISRRDFIALVAGSVALVAMHESINKHTRKVASIESKPRDESPFCDVYQVSPIFINNSNKHNCLIYLQ